MIICVLCCVVFVPFGSMAQTLEELPKRAIDTVATADPETKIILYTNNTFSYYRPTLDAKFADTQVYNEHWDTTQVFSYRIVQLADLPEELEIEVIGSLNDFCPPTVGRVSSKYGPRGRRSHNGVDVPLKNGEPIRAAFDGKVRYSKYNTGGYGGLVIIRHENGLETWYAHLCRRNVASGEYVKAGQVIGFGGNTGRSFGAHLHFEVRYCDQTFDPERLFDFEAGNIKYQTFVLDRSYFNIRSRETDLLIEDEDLEMLGSLVKEDGTELTSEEIVARIQQAADAKLKEDAAKAGKTSGSSSGAVYHTVKSGDILGKISRKYGVSIDQICRLNNIKRTTTLRLGQKLRVK